MPALKHALAIAALAVLAGAGCAGLDSEGSGGPSANAPVLRVGDRWVYNTVDGFRVPLVWTETHEVTSVAPGAITVHSTETGPNARGSRTETWAAPGLLMTGAIFDDESRRFATPARIYAFPLTPGKAWNQWVKNDNESTQREGEINRYVRVGDWVKVSTPAGTFDALRMRVLMRLDNDEFWRFPTECNYVVYYAPSVGAMVRAEKDAQYFEKGDRRDGYVPIREQHAAVELVSFTHAP